MTSVLDDEDYERSSSDDSDAAIRSMVAAYQQESNNNSYEKKKGHKRHRATTKKRNKNQHGLDGLREVVSDLIRQCEQHHLFVPPPTSSSESGKVWSSRIYGADKKQQRKQTERLLLERRILQLEQYLQEKGISLPKQPGRQELKRQEPPISKL